MAGPDAERTERPTPKRLEEARKKGQVPRSPELNAAAVVLIAGAGLYLLGGVLGSSLFEMMRTHLALPLNPSGFRIYSRPVDFIQDGSSPTVCSSRA